METHKLHEELLRKTVEVLVVGCGGNGSAIVGGLPFLQQAMIAQGHPYGLHVTVMDGDAVSAVNCVRQPFSKREVSLNKAVVLVNRINLFWGLRWTAIPRALTEQTLHPEYAGYKRTISAAGYCDRLCGHSGGARDDRQEYFGVKPDRVLGRFGKF